MTPTSQLYCIPRWLYTMKRVIVLAYVTFEVYHYITSDIPYKVTCLIIC